MMKALIMPMVAFTLLGAAGNAAELFEKKKVEECFSAVSDLSPGRRSMRKNSYFTG